MSIQYPVHVSGGASDNASFVHIRDSKDRVIAGGILAEDAVEIASAMNAQHGKRKSKKIQIEEALKRSDLTAIERINNDGNYEPGNVKWATRHEQNRNQRSNVNLTVDGVTKCVADWESVTGTPRNTIYTRHT